MHSQGPPHRGAPSIRSRGRGGHPSHPNGIPIRTDNRFDCLGNDQSVGDRYITEHPSDWHQEWERGILDYSPGYYNGDTQWPQHRYPPGHRIPGRGG